MKFYEYLKCRLLKIKENKIDRIGRDLVEIHSKLDKITKNFCGIVKVYPS